MPLNTLMDYLKVLGGLGGAPAVGTPPFIPGQGAPPTTPGDAAAQNPQNQPVKPKKTTGQKVVGALTDPGFQAFTATVGHALSQPQMPGQSQLQQISGGLVQGYGALAQQAAMRQAQERQNAMDAIKIIQAGAEVRNKDANTGKTRTETAGLPQEQADKHAKTQADIKVGQQNADFQQMTAEASQTNAATNRMNAETQQGKLTEEMRQNRQQNALAQKRIDVEMKRLEEDQRHHDEEMALKKTTEERLKKQGEWNKTWKEKSLAILQQQADAHTTSANAAATRANAEGDKENISFKQGTARNAAILRQAELIVKNKMPGEEIPLPQVMQQAEEHVKKVSPELFKAQPQGPATPSDKKPGAATIVKQSGNEVEYSDGTKAMWNGRQWVRKAQ